MIGLMGEDDHVARLKSLGHRLIAAEMQKADVIGGALHGSLAIGTMWSTSDLDYCIFPVTSRPPRELASVPAYRTYNDCGTLVRHNLYAELRVVEGVYVNMAVKRRSRSNTC